VLVALCCCGDAGDDHVDKRSEINLAHLEASDYEIRVEDVTSQWLRFCDTGCNVLLDALLKGRVLYYCEHPSQARAREVSAGIAGSSMFMDGTINRGIDHLGCGAAGMRDGTVLIFSFAKDKWEPTRL
jgi:hypothetical protein